MLITGEGFKLFLEYLITFHQLTSYQEKLISENLVAGNSFERLEIQPKSKAFKKIYENFSKIELTSSRYSVYPQLTDQLEDNFIDVEATNQFDDLEIISLKNHLFFISCAFCPQISSTRDMPHPIVYTFMKMAAYKKHQT